MKKLLIAFLIIMATQCKATGNTTHNDHHPLSLYDRVTIEIKEAHHIKTVVISSMIALIVCLIAQKLQSNHRDIVIRPVSGNEFSLSFR